jgi:hypothetical protein
MVFTGLECVLSCVQRCRKPPAECDVRCPCGSMMVQRER